MTLDYTVLMMTDGRDGALDLALESLDYLYPPPARVVIHDDTGNADHARALRLRYPDAMVIGEGPRRGFTGAIQYAWASLDASPAQRQDRQRFIFHTEDDFQIQQGIDVGAMAHALISHPDMAQLALLRYPVNAAERAAGGVIEQRPGEYHREQCLAGCCTWRSHQLYWTTNPSLFRSDLLSLGWPDGPDSETRMGPHVMRYLSALRSGEATPPLTLGGMPTVSAPRFAYWGDGPTVHHLGDDRHPEATGY